MNPILIDNSGANGELSRLFANGFNPYLNRPYIGDDGKSYVSVPCINADGTKSLKSVLIANAATLRYDEWKLIDTALVGIRNRRLTGVQDLVSRGLVKPIDGYPVTSLQWEQINGGVSATMSMDPDAKGKSGGIEYTPKSLPLPIIHTEVSISDRYLQASRRMGTPIDVSEFEVQGQQVLEYSENMLFNGCNSFKYGDGTIYGYLDYPSAHSTSYTTSKAWDDAAVTGEDIVKDVQKLVALALANRSYGPWVIYVPSAFYIKLTSDFKAASDKSVLQRIKEISPQIQDVKPSEFVTAKKIVMVEMNKNCVELVQGMPLTTVQWQTHDLSRHYFKILTIEVPRIRTDANSKSGVFIMA